MSSVPKKVDKLNLSLSLVISVACKHFIEGNFAEFVVDITNYQVFENYIFENTDTSCRGQ